MYQVYFIYLVIVGDELEYVSSNIFSTLTIKEKIGFEYGEEVNLSLFYLNNIKSSL